MVGGKQEELRRGKGGWGSSTLAETPVIHPRKIMCRIDRGWEGFGGGIPPLGTRYGGHAASLVTMGCRGQRRPCRCLYLCFSSSCRRITQVYWVPIIFPPAYSAIFAHLPHAKSIRASNLPFFPPVRTYARVPKTPRGFLYIYFIGWWCSDSLSIHIFANHLWIIKSLFCPRPWWSHKKHSAISPTRPVLRAC
jgi:hypothetical protein